MSTLARQSRLNPALAQHGEREHHRVPKNANSGIPRVGIHLPSSHPRIRGWSDQYSNNSARSSSANRHSVPTP